MEKDLEGVLHLEISILVPSLVQCSPGVASSACQAIDGYDTLRSEQDISNKLGEIFSKKLFYSKVPS